MRILFAFVGGYGHFEPLVPIAHAAEARGHAVTFTCKPAMVSVVRGRGFDAVSTEGDTGSAMDERLPLLRFDAQREEAAVRTWFAHEIARRRSRGVAARAQQWSADVVVCDEIDFGAMLAAERLGVPHASVVVLAAGGFLRPDIVGAPLESLRAELGLPPDPELHMLGRHLVIAPLPPSLRDPQYELPATTLWVRPAVLDTAGAAGATDVVPDGCIYVTLGTEFNRESGDLFARVLRGVARLGPPVLVTVGHGIDPAEIAGQPDSVRVAQYVPQTAVLPRARLVVSHGGSGSVIGALACGVPVLVLPMGADQGLNARRVEDLGVGAALDAVDATSDEIATAAGALLDDGSARERARAIAAECADLQPVDAAVDRIEELPASALPGSTS